MLFLLNTVVVKTQLGLELPEGLAALANASPASVLQIGGELHARHPRLEHERPDIARWYCTLLLARFPTAGGVRFVPTTHGYAPRLAEVALPHLVRLWSLQQDGVDITREAWETVWAAQGRAA